MNDRNEKRTQDEPQAVPPPAGDPRRRRRRAGAAGFPTIVRASALGKNGAVAPIEPHRHGRHRLRHAGPGEHGNFLEKAEVQWVAVCDLDNEHLAEAKGTVDKKYGNADCATYHDFRELFARGDLDAVSIAVPDHWHAILAISALRAGLDVYGEKPLTHNLREGRALCDAVKRYGRVWQTG